LKGENKVSEKEKVILELTTKLQEAAAKVKDKMSIIDKLTTQNKETKK
jgi:hypothetical protein